MRMEPKAFAVLCLSVPQAHHGKGHADPASGRSLFCPQTPICGQFVFLILVSIDIAALALKPKKKFPKRLYYCSNLGKLNEEEGEILIFRMDSCTKAEWQM